MRITTGIHTICFTLATIAVSPVWAEDSSAPPATAPDPSLSETDKRLLEEALNGETILIEGDDSVQPGSAHVLDAEVLERFENDDIHRILSTVPGVYMREEDGYGLRPNIGIRGSGSERSGKIALLEDGVLIAPAPYSAPAAYYFPLVTRMRAIEVVKGAVAVRHGPNTVGGAINLVSNGIPVERVAAIDMAVGGDLYGKVHGQLGDVGRNWGYWFEGVKLHTNGFKVLDSGGDTGFDKNDALGRVRINSNPDLAVYNQLDLTLGYSDEVSDETYTGLSEADFAQSPSRRYAATQLDKMNWTHWTARVKHKLELGDKLDLNTTVYHHRFQRDWRKLVGFSGTRGLAEVLKAPELGLNSIFYGVITGQNDTGSSAEHLVLGTNARRFASQGAQSVLHTVKKTGDVEHDLSVGLRLHLDEARRITRDSSYSMIGGVLERDDIETIIASDTDAEARAWALFVQDSLQWKGLHLTGGFRAEIIATSWRNNLDPSSEEQNELSSVFIPGLGAFYALTQHWGVLAGVHKGFVPVAPGQPPGVEPETSFNYEAGVRYGDASFRAEAIGFFNDYNNLKATCSFSAGCTPDMVFSEFNGKGAIVAGLETFAGGEILLGDLLEGLSAPLRMSYTFNTSSFDQDFESDNPQWGDVKKGDELPYFAKHQLGVHAGLRTERYEVASSFRYVGATRDIVGQGAIPDEERIDAYAVIDLAFHLRLGAIGHLYATVDNLLNTRYAVSRRPIGLRPGKSRLLIVGYKNQW
ncbi:MAG: TonB-dependent receptor [Kofleriaceae bacterium]|nr:TonB-dependent receptor [Kofleriaceae bacterium]